MKLNIALTDGTLKQVEAKMVMINAIACFHHDNTVSEYKSGMRIADTIEGAQFMLDAYKFFEIERSNKGKLKHAGINIYPVNP